MAHFFSTEYACVLVLAILVCISSGETIEDQLYQLRHNLVTSIWLFNSIGSDSNYPVRSLLLY